MPNATTTTMTAAQQPQTDADVSEVLRSFYQDQLPTMALRTGLTDKNGQNISCNYSMLQKSLFVDYDADGQKEIVLLYDVSELTGEKNRDVIVFMDEKDGAPVVVTTESGSYGASGDEETSILSKYNGRVCKVRFIHNGNYEAVLIQYFTDGAWQTGVTAYHHLSDHDGVQLEADSCYIDHSGGDLYLGVTGQISYGKEKFLNFRTVNDNYINLITALLAETLLP